MKFAWILCLGAIFCTLGTPVSARRKKKKKKASSDGLSQDQQALLSRVQEYLAGAGAQHAAGDSQGAVDILSEAIAAIPTVGQLYSVRASIRAGIAQSEHEFIGVFEDYEQALALNPTDYKTMTNLGAAMSRLDRHAEALHYFESALEINPADENALSYRGYALERLGEVQAARDSDAKAADVLPQSTMIRHNYALSLRDAGQASAAKREWEEILESDPEHVPSLVGLAQLLVDEQGTDSLHMSLDLLRRAIALSPGNVDARLQLCWQSALACDNDTNSGTNEHLGCRERSVQYCDEALTIGHDNNDAATCFHACATKAKILFAAGLTQQSLQLYATLLKQISTTTDIPHVFESSIQSCDGIGSPEHADGGPIAVIPPSYVGQQCVQSSADCFTNNTSAVQVSKLPASIKFLPQLRSLALALEASSRARAVSNKGGWHSDPAQWGFLDLASPSQQKYLEGAALATNDSLAQDNSQIRRWSASVAELRAWIVEEVHRYLATQMESCCATIRDGTNDQDMSCGPNCICTARACSLRNTADTPRSFPHRVYFESSWINVNLHGHANAPHNHGAVTVSGVFYIDSGSNDTSATHLRIQCPLLGSDGYPCAGNHSITSVNTDGSVLGDEPGAVPSGSMTRVVGSGESGTLVLWPGYIDHDVEEHTGNQPRISMAFNVWVVSNSSFE